MGILELAGAIELIVPRVTSLAALGPCGVMIGAIFTQLFILDRGLVALTPAFFMLLPGFIIRGRRNWT